MSAQALIAQDKLTPASVASNLLDVIKDIELSIKYASTHVSTIENRSWFKSTFSSAKTDLVTVSKSQNKINDMMLSLVQEVITLNTMSYSFLVAVIGELETRSREGWINAEGQFQTLSHTGQSFADKAQSIFLKIAEGSKNTQERIELNKANIDDIKQALMVKAELVARQSQDIAHIQQTLSHKAERLASIDALLSEKSSLDDQQNQAIHAIVDELRENSRLDQERTDMISRLDSDLQALQDKLANWETWSGSYYRRTRFGLAVLATSTAFLAAALVASLTGLI